MKNNLKTAAAGIVAVLIMSSCQQVFTYSAFSFVETDFSNMNEDQQVSYAEDLLSSGTEEELEEAYAAISAMLKDVDLGSTDLSADDVELIELAAELAIGATPVGSAVTTALDAFTSTDDSEDAADIAETILSGFDESDYSSLQNAVDLTQAAVNNDAELSSEQYANAAAAQLLVIVNNVGGTDNLSSIDSDDEELTQDLEQALAWAEAGGVDLSSILGDVTLPE